MSDTINLYLEVLAVSDNGLKVTDGEIVCWLPKSKIKVDGRRIQDLREGDEADFVVPIWLATNESLI